MLFGREKGRVKLTRLHVDRSYRPVAGGETGANSVGSFGARFEGSHQTVSLRMSVCKASQGAFDATQSDVDPRFRYTQ